MKEMANGLYAWQGEFPSDGEMPCRADQLRKRFVPYMAPSTLGKAEDEEAAMRIIYPSIYHGEWVGVTLKYLVKKMQLEFEAERAVANVVSHNINEDLEAEKARQRYVLLCVLTLGIYALFASWPKPNRKEVTYVPPQHLNSMPVSVLPVYGPDAIVNAISRLINQGLVKVKKEQDIEVLFPTPTLVKVVAQIE